MFGGLELKSSSDRKRDGDVHAVSTDAAPTNAASGFSFLQTSVAPSTPSASTSAFSFLSSTEPSTLPAPEDIASSNSSFSFISSASPTPSHGSGALNTKDSTSGFSFVDTIPDPSSTSYGEDILSLNAPTATASTTTKRVDLNFMGSKIPDTDKGNESVSHHLTAASHMGSSLNHSWGPHVLSETNATSDKGTNNYDDDILTMKNPAAQPIGQGIVFGGTASSKAAGTIKKRSRTYKVGTGTTLEDVAPASSEQATPSPIESRPHPEQETSTISTDNGYTSQTITRPSTVAEDAEKALQKAAVFMEEKSTEATNMKTNDPVVKGPSVETTSPSPNKDMAYQQAVAAAQEAKGIIKQSSGSSFMSGLFKRSSNTPGIPAFSSHSSSSSNKAPSFIPSVKISSANVDPHTKGYGSSYVSSNAKVEIHQQAVVNSTVSSSRNVNDDKGTQITTVEVQDAEIGDATHIQNTVVEEENIAPPVKIEAPIDIKPDESLHVNGTVTNEEIKMSDELQVQAKYGSAVVPSNRPSSLLDAVLNDFFTRCMRTNELIERMKARQMAHTADLSAAEKELQLTSYRISQAESHQMIAAEREEFDLAEALASDIEKYLRAKTEQEKIVLKAKEAINDLDKQRESAIHTIALEFRNVQEKLMTFKKEQETVGRENVMAVIEQFALTSKRVSAENDRLTSDLKNIERDETFVEQERKELESQISEQSQDLYHLRDTARDQLEVARKEVEELKKLLAAKEAQASQLSLVVAQHDASIMQVRSKFSRQITRVEKKEMAVKESRNEWEGELATFKKQKEKHETEVAAHSEYLLSKERIILRAQREISCIDKIEDIIMKEVFVGDVDMSAEFSSLVDLEGSVVALQVAVDEANQGLLSAQVAVDRIQDEISSIQAKLPMLEAEKREAAAKRDFKAAGKASKEIKDLTARREECESILSGECKDRLEQAHKDLEKVTSELCAKRELVQVRRVEIGRSQMIQIAVRIRKLQKLKVESEDVASKSDDSDDVSVISSTACSIIATRIASLMSLGEQIGVTYGGWDEILQESSGDNRKESTEEEQIVISVAPEVPDTNSTNPVNDDEAVPPCVTDTDHESTEVVASSEYDIIPTVTNDIKVDKENAIIRFREISTTLKILEREVEKAVSEENYEEATEFEETMTSLRTEMESLGISDADVVELDNNINDDEQQVTGMDEVVSSDPSPEEETSLPAVSPVESDVAE